MYKIEKSELGVCSADGFFADGIVAGLKGEDKKDLAFIYSPTMCTLAKVLTSNKMAAAPIHHAKGKIGADFVLINSKNANAMTGVHGLDDLEDILTQMQNKYPQVKAPLMSSTGVIGVRLPKEKIIKASESFDLSVKNSKNASQAIMTTDKFSKEIAFKVTLDDNTSFSIGAIAKGAGMINPAMATMLCFITTDADLPQDEMQEILNEVNELSFNAVSVDGDTSTNDTVFLMSNSLSKTYNKEAFKEALKRVMKFLALELVRDGEGSTKVVEYKITGAKDNKEAMQVAKTLSNSLLIKTALYGEDPNWGRLAMSIGASGVECDEKTLSIKYDDVFLYKDGVNLFDEKVEIEASKVMKQDSFTIHCELGVADGSYSAYGCDLGYEYIKINADYRT